MVAASLLSVGVMGGVTDNCEVGVAGVFCTVISVSDDFGLCRIRNNCLHIGPLGLVWQSDNCSSCIICIRILGDICLKFAWGLAAADA